MMSRPIRVQRRRHERRPVTLECSWAGGARITDLSASGCFVDCSQVPEVGEPAEFTVHLEGMPTILRGPVVHARRGLGFAIEFRYRDEFSSSRVWRYLVKAAVPPQRTS
jgi:hypothetical protein